MNSENVINFNARFNFCEVKNIDSIILFFSIEINWKTIQNFLGRRQRSIDTL